MDYKNACRVCLKKIESKFIPIGSYTKWSSVDGPSTGEIRILTMLVEITGDIFDLFTSPNGICTQCLADLQAAYTFKVRCNRATEQLTNLAEDNILNLDDKDYDIDEDKPLDQIADETKPETRSQHGSVDEKPKFQTVILEEHEIDGAFDQDNDESIEENVDFAMDSEDCDDKKENEASDKDYAMSTDYFTSDDEASDDSLVKQERSKAPKTPKQAKPKPAKPKQATVKSDPGGRPTCDVCGQSFTRPFHLRRHMTIHTGERNFECDQCDKTFRRAEHLRVHLNKHANIRPFVCEHCSKTFSRSSHMQRHLETIHAEKIGGSHPCADCEKTFFTARQLDRHREVHEPQKYDCPHCPKRFARKIKLADHVRSHTKEKPFLCSLCGARFGRNDYLLIHMRRHTGEKPYKCKFCDKGFPRTTDLKVHERYHTNEKTHTCLVCGKGFQRGYNLTIHMRVHTGEKPYKCDQCPRSFTQSNDLKTHIRRHTGERFRCDRCDMAFLHMYHLTNHKRDAHGLDAETPNRRIEKYASIDENDPSTSQENLPETTESVAFQALQQQ